MRGLIAATLVLCTAFLPDTSLGSSRHRLPRYQNGRIAFVRTQDSVHVEDDCIPAQ